MQTRHLRTLTATAMTAALALGLSACVDNDEADDNGPDVIVQDDDPDGTVIVPNNDEGDTTINEGDTTVNNTEAPQETTEPSDPATTEPTG